MGSQVLITADGTSRLTQYASLLSHQWDLIRGAAERDAAAMEVLGSTFPLITALQRAEREYWDNKRGEIPRRGWTRRDERRLNWIRGLSRDSIPICRLARVVDRCPQAHVDAYRHALDEVRQDGTASVLSAILADAKAAHETLLDEARFLADQDRLVARPVFTSEEDHYITLAALLDHLPRPKPRPATKKHIGRNPRKKFTDAEIREFDRRGRRLLASEPKITRDKFAKQLGISFGAASKLPCWEANPNKRATCRSGPRPKRIGLDVAVEKKSLEDHELLRLIREQDQDARIDGIDLD